MTTDRRSCSVPRFSLAAATLLLVSTMVFAQPADQPPWERMDYGPFLSTAVGIGDGVPPVHKGIVVQLGDAEGNATEWRAVFDTDLLAWRCVWRGELALEGIVFNGPHGTYPEIIGEPMLVAGVFPGVAGSDGSVLGDPRDEPAGPIPESLGRWGGLHLAGDHVVLEYSLDDGRHRVRERVRMTGPGMGAAFVREITVQSERPGERGPVLLTGRVATEIPADGSVRLVYRDGDVSVEAADLAMSFAAMIDDASPRWDRAVVTEGLVGVRADTGESGRLVTQRAGDPSMALKLLDAQDMEAEVLESFAAVRSPRPEAVERAREWLRSDSAVGWWPSDTGEGSLERNAVTGQFDLRLDGVTWRRGVGGGRSLDFDGTAAAWLGEEAVDPSQEDITVAAWIATRQDGTVFAIAPREGDWAPDGVTLFLRNGLLTFDVGWVGVVSGGPVLTDGAWTHVAAVWRHRDGRVTLYVNGTEVASASLPLRGAARDDFAPRFGWTNQNFPGVSRFSGYMDNAVILRRAVDGTEVAALAAATGQPIVEAVRVRDANGRTPGVGDLAAERSENGDVAVVLRLPAADADRALEIAVRRGPRDEVLDWAAEDGSAIRAEPFRVDKLTWPVENPWHSWMRFGAFDFAADDDQAAYLTTWSGDVWRVDGLDEDLDELRWTRVATGLNQPFGVVSLADGPLVLGRDQITRLVDANRDGEADWYENFSNLTRNSEHFHEPASGLLVARDGSLLYHKAARHAKLALHSHHGTVIRVSPDGQQQEVVAHGFRAPIGLGILPDGSLLGSDQEGHWTPANRINLIRPPADGEQARFYGNSWAAPRAAGERLTRGGERVHAPWPDSEAMTPPLCWIHPIVDRSPSAQLFVDHPAWGALRGSILGLSYGTGDVYLVLREDVELDGEPVAQGGIVKLGVRVPTGLLAGKVHPRTGDLYLCGLVGWSSDQPDVGGFYRVRPNVAGWAESLNVPHVMRTHADGIELSFLHPLDPETGADPGSWEISAWNYRRDANYGSSDYDLSGAEGSRTRWVVDAATLSPDGRSVRLAIRDFEPAMQVHVAWDLLDAAGRSLRHEAHLTVHATED